MPSTTIARTETGFSLGTNFASLDNLLSSSLSSAFVVPSGYSRIVRISFGVATDDVVESCTMLRVSGNAMTDSEQFFAGPSMNTMGTSTGAFNGTVHHEVDLSIRSGSSIELAAGATAALTAEVMVVITLA